MVTDEDRIKVAVEKAKKLVEEMKLEEPYKSLTFQKLLDKFLFDKEKIKEEEKPSNMLTESIEKGTVLKGSTCADAIINILKEDFGSMPRSLQEIEDALKVAAIFYSKQAIQTTLIRLVRKGVLRRLREKEGYKYILASR